LIFTPEQKHILEIWIATTSSLEDVFFRSVERRYMDPDDVLSGEGTASKGGRFAAKGMRAVYLSATDSGASKETTERKKRLGGEALINTAKYPRVVYAVTVKLDRVLRLDDLASSAEGSGIRDLCLNDDLAASILQALRPLVNHE
jgi:RES domain-containing protein